MDNAFVESFNGKLRAECLNTHWFETLEEAQAILEAWRKEYNTERPHTALGLKTPAEFAEEWQPPEAENTDFQHANWTRKRVQVMEPLLTMFPSKVLPQLQQYPDS